MSMAFSGLIICSGPPRGLANIKTKFPEFSDKARPPIAVLGYIHSSTAFLKSPGKKSFEVRTVLYFRAKAKSQIYWIVHVESKLAATGSGRVFAVVENSPDKVRVGRKWLLLDLHLKMAVVFEAPVLSLLLFPRTFF